MNELKTAMALRGVRASDLAQKMEISKQQLSNYINGVRAIGPKMAQTLSGLLGVSEAYLRGMAQRLPVCDVKTGKMTACRIMSEDVIDQYGIFYVVEHPATGPKAVILADGVQFTTGREADDDQPAKAEEISRYHWMAASGRDAMMLRGLPRDFISNPAAFPMDASDLIDIFGLRLNPDDRGKVQITEHADFALEREYELTKAKPAILEELARRERETLYPDTIDYVVNDKSCQGAYNGFRAHDKAVCQILLDDYGPMVDWLGLGDDNRCLLSKVADRSRDGADAERIREACMPYYEPYERSIMDVAIAKQWESLGLITKLGMTSPETLQKRLDNKEAAGVCHVPYDMAKGFICGLAASILRECLPGAIQGRRDKLAQIARQKEEGVLPSTLQEDETRARSMLGELTRMLARATQDEQ